MPIVDIERLFLKPVVHRLIYRVMNRDPAAVHKPRMATRKNPVVKMLTDAELQQVLSDAKKATARRLQIPPAMNPVSAAPKVYETNEDLIGYSKQKFVFTDITPGLDERSRHVVVREPDGKLRDASVEERNRVLQIYYPREGRRILVPKLLTESDLLERLLTAGRYDYVLDRALVQYEPDDPRYVALCTRVFEAVERRRDFETLRTTRHFGTLLLHFVAARRIDVLLVHLLNLNLMDEARCLLLLYAAAHPEDAFSKAVSRSFKAEAPTSETGASGEEALHQTIELEANRKDVSKSETASLVELYITNRPPANADYLTEELRAALRSCQSQTTSTRKHAH